jgi:cyclopropane-fatty-acyl-phospholipid synthase
MMSSKSASYSAPTVIQTPDVFKKILQQAGIRINGAQPWDMQVHDPHVFDRILQTWSLGLGESYMDGQWDCQRLDEFFYRLMRQDLDESVHGFARLRLLYEVARAKALNLQSKDRAFQVGEQHYNAGNDLFERILDPMMIYSCGYWTNADSLTKAQEQKLDLICKKLQLQSGESLLEIGCGWGGLAKFAAERYGVNVLGITVSSEQQALAMERCRGLPVEIRLIDYRDLHGSFDKIVSVGMFEHVGQKNYAEYFDIAHRLLKDQGIFLLHTIGSYATVQKTDAWIDRYIFPNGHLPSLVELSQALERRFLLEDLHNFGHDYDKTLMAWLSNFEKSWPDLQTRYSKRFYRMWRYYLCCCAGFFRSGQGQLWQLVLTKRAREQTYVGYRPSS